MDRRRFLLTVGANKWLTYPFEFLYHSLIPTQINGSKVQDKAKLTKIYGNGVVENQLVNLDQTVPVGTVGKLSGNNTNITSDLDKRTVKMVSIGASVSYFGAGVGYLSGLQGHKVMCLAKVVDVSLASSSYATISFGWCLENLTVNHPATPSDPNIYHIGTFRSNIGSNYLNIESLSPSPTAGDYIEVSDMQMIDLTLMFGTGNEPTTLTDNRIQALLNRGYIPYNTGSYKNSRVGEIACYTFPKELIGASSLLTYSGSRTLTTSGNYANLYRNYGGDAGVEFSAFTNEQLNHKFFAYAEIEYNSSNNLTNMSFASQGTISSAYVIESHSKICSIISPTQASVSVYVYGSLQPSITLGRHFLVDLTELGIDNLTAQQVFELLNDATINSLANGDTLSSPSSKITLNGLLELNGAINSHDTMEITKTGYVFTKNVNNIVYNGNANENWQEYGSGSQRFTILNNLWSSPSSSIVANILCDRLQPCAKNEIFNKEYAISGSDDNVNYFVVRINSSINDVSSLKTWLSNNPINVSYQLATPQVITIPRKHLGIVDLGSLNWHYQNDWQGSKKRFFAYFNKMKDLTDSTLVGHIFTKKYTTVSNTDFYVNDKNFTIAQVGGGNDGYIELRDDDYTSASAFKSAMAGVYLFYETDAEVSDFDNIAQINAGGSINANEFSANFEQVIENGDFTDTSAWSFFSGDSDNTFTVSGNVGVLKMYSYGDTTIFRQQYTPVSGHKYLLVADYRVTTLTQSFSWVLGSNTIDLLFASTTYQRLVNIGTRTDANPTFGISLSVTRSIDFRLRNVKYIDLTETFGAGNEPTSENDYRVQYILNGGSLDAVAETEVLPNVNFKIKCK